MNLAKLSQKLKKVMHRTAQMFFVIRRGNPDARFLPKAYYLVMPSPGGIAVITLRPYFGWHVAYRAAKSFHRKAFIATGHRLNTNFLGATA